MKPLFAALLVLASGLAGAQPVLEFREDLAFQAAEVDALAAREYAAQLGFFARAHRLDRDAALKERLARILPRLQRAAAYERPAAASIAWEIHTCTDCDENASAAAGGKLLVSADFVAELALTDDELAYMLGHEMAHVLAEHTREFATLARFFVGNGLARDYADIQQELYQNLPVLLRMRPVYEQQELEADYMGFVLAARAGFAPQAMISMLAKLPAEDSVIATHPSELKRAEQARAMLDAGKRLAAEAGAL